MYPYLFSVTVTNVRLPATGGRKVIGASSRTGIAGGRIRTEIPQTASASRELNEQKNISAKT